MMSPKARSLLEWHRSELYGLQKLLGPKHIAAPVIRNRISEVEGHLETETDSPQTDSPADDRGNPSEAG
jgi:hypothetical protein